MRANEVMIKMPELKAVIASRATHSENNTYGRFYKSYISDVRMTRSIIGINGFIERTFIFKYKGKKFEIIEKYTDQFSLRSKYYLREVIQ